MNCIKLVVAFYSLSISLMCVSADASLQTKQTYNSECADLLRDFMHGSSSDLNQSHHNPVEFLQTLADSKADLNVQEPDGYTLLHVVATHAEPTDHRSPALMTFLCNAGLNPNAKTKSGHTPLHNQCAMMHCIDGLPYGYSMENATILSWYGASYLVTNADGNSAIDIARRSTPLLVGHVQALKTVVPRVKEQHKTEYTKLLATHLTAGPAGMVMTYVEPSWGTRAWSDVSDDIAQQISSRKE